MDNTTICPYCDNTGIVNPNKKFIPITTLGGSVINRASVFNVYCDCDKGKEEKEVSMQNITDETPKLAVVTPPTKKSKQ